MKTQMQLANRAWRTETRSLGWQRGWKKGRKQWKAFCRGNAEATIEMQQYNLDEPFANQDEANESVAEELTYWND